MTQQKDTTKDTTNDTTKDTTKDKPKYTTKHHVNLFYLEVYCQKIKYTSTQTIPKGVQRVLV
jgi:hypothetical protein